MGSEAAMPSVCGVANELESCSISEFGDPENPICARLTLTGKLVNLDEDSDEYKKAKAAIFQRHMVMKDWPGDHEWLVSKLVIEYIWFIDFFGGADIMDVEEYYGANLSNLPVMPPASSPSIEQRNINSSSNGTVIEATSSTLYLAAALMLSLIALVYQTMKQQKCESISYRPVYNNGSIELPSNNNGVVS